VNPAEKSAIKTTQQRNQSNRDALLYEVDPIFWAGSLSGSALNNERASMPRTRKSYAPILKAKVTIELIQGNETVTQTEQTFSAHPNLVTLLEKTGDSTSSRSVFRRSGKATERHRDELNMETPFSAAATGDQAKAEPQMKCSG
jgi:hypothetical protein